MINFDMALDDILNDYVEEEYQSYMDCVDDNVDRSWYGDVDPDDIVREQVKWELSGIPDDEEHKGDRLGLLCVIRECFDWCRITRQIPEDRWPGDHFPDDGRHSELELHIRDVARHVVELGGSVCPAVVMRDMVDTPLVLRSGSAGLIHELSKLEIASSGYDPDMIRAMVNTVLYAMNEYIKIKDKEKK